MYTRNCRCTCTNIYKLCILFIYFLLVLLFIFYFLQIYTRYASRKHAHVDVLCSCVGINTHNTHNISRHIHTQTSICYTCLLHTVHDRQRLRQGSLAVLLREEESEGGRGGARVLVCVTRRSSIVACIPPHLLLVVSPNPYPLRQQLARTHLARDTTLRNAYTSIPDVRTGAKRDTIYSKRDLI